MFTSDLRPREDAYKVTYIIVLYNGFCGGLPLCPEVSVGFQPNASSSEEAANASTGLGVKGCHPSSRKDLKSARCRLQWEVP